MRSGRPRRDGGVSNNTVYVRGRRKYLLLENIDDFAEMFRESVAPVHVGCCVHEFILIRQLDVYTARRIE